MATGYLMLGAQGQQVAGDSNDPAHKGWIELNSVSRPGSGSAFGGGSGGVRKGDMRQIDVSKMTDSSSPVLWAACAEGRRFETAVIDMAGGQMQIVLSEVYVTSCNNSGRGGYAAETVSLSFDSAKQTYTPPAP